MNIGESTTGTRRRRSGSLRRNRSKKLQLEDDKGNNKAILKFVLYEVSFNAVLG
jgi:hypothetical protein